KELQRLLRARGEWNRLADVIAHHITLLVDAQLIAELYLEMGDIYYKELARVDRAEQAYNKAREAAPKSAPALHALGRLYERSGNWFQALDMLQREAELLGGVDAALPLLARIGRINADMLGDRDSARDAYRRALTIQSAYAPALEALREMARQSEDWATYSDYLITQAETADDPEQKTELFCEAAQFFSEIKHDDTAAIRFYQRALGLTVDHPGAARALADLYFKLDRWVDAREMYQVVARTQDRMRDVQQYCQTYYRLGRTSELVGAKDEALNYYKQAVEADVNYLPALEGYSQALAVAGRWEESYKAYQTVLIHHRDALTTAEVVEIQHQLGFLCVQQKQPDRAYKQFEKALEFYFQTLDIFQHTQEENSEKLATCLNNIGSTYIRIDK
ncbi:MAG: tetratricopeptide repeat protein, partial [Cytophagaceae bacterium]